MGDKQGDDKLIGKKRKRPSKKLEYEIEEEREDIAPRQKIAEKVSNSKRRASSKTTASSGKSIDF